MTTKKIQIRILPDGMIEAETFGFKGKACLETFAILEKLMNAQVVDSDYKPEFYEEENLLQSQQSQQERNGL